MYSSVRFEVLKVVTQDCSLLECEST